MTSCKQLEIRFEDRKNQSKWCYPLKEDVFASFVCSKENDPTMHKGSFFSPLLFGKFFDPSDAFPLWEFDSDVLLPPSLQSSTHRSVVDWFQTSNEYFLKAQLPAGTSKNNVQVCIENGKILEVNGEWRQHERDSKTKVDWKSSSHWWELGYVRRLELPDQTDWKKTEAHLKNDTILEIRVPKLNANAAECDRKPPQEN